VLTSVHVEATAEQLEILQDFEDTSKGGEKKLTQIKKYQADSEQEGGLVTQSIAAMVLCVSTPRISQLINAGTLQTYDHFGKRLISANQLIEYARLQKHSGNVGNMIAQAFKNKFSN